MINLAKFCPFERIALLLSRFIAEKGGDCFDMVLDGLSFKGLPVDKKQQDFGLGVSELARRNFMMKPEVIGEFSVIKNNTIVASRKIKVLNKLLTDKVEDLQKTPNASNGYEHFCYPEARFTADNINVTREDGEVDLAVARPLFMYFIGRRSDSVVEILGPAPLKRYHTVGTASVDGVSSRIIFEGSDSDMLEEIVPIASEEKISVTSAAHVVLVHDTHETPFVMSQSVYTFNGHRLSAELLVKIIKTIAHYERIGQRDGIRIELTERFGHLYFSDKQEEFYGNEVLHDSIVNESLSFLATHNNYVMIEHKGKFGKLMGENSASCFAISLAMMLSSFIDGTITTWLNAIKAGLDQGLFVINKNGVIEGMTRLLENTGKAFDFPSLINPCRLFLTRETTKTVPQGEGLVILGFDHTGGNLVQGEPDHYVVCSTKKGRLILLYDPLQKFVTVGADMTSFLTQPDANIIIMRGKFE